MVAAVRASDDFPTPQSPKIKNCRPAEFIARLTAKKVLVSTEQPLGRSDRSRRSQVIPKNLADLLLRNARYRHRLPASFNTDRRPSVSRRGASSLNCELPQRPSTWPAPQRAAWFALYPQADVPNGGLESASAFGQLLPHLLQRHLERSSREAQGGAARLLLAGCR